MDQRTQFVLAVREQGVSVAQACRDFGVSRKTGYKWLARFDDHGVEGLSDQPRAPKRSPDKTPEHLEARIVRARQRFGWGARKIIGWLRLQSPELDWPAPSTAHDILARHGLIAPQQPAKRVPQPDAPPSPLARATAPNQLWSVDHKGKFRLGDGSYCYPLTITDNFSRMVLGCWALGTTNSKQARACMERTFERWGVPQALRSDNGTPFASRGVLGLSTLSAWWRQLGIAHERIDPGRPDQNGRHERMHLTLKRATTRPAGHDLGAQQGRFDLWLEHFNHERPHEALGQLPPAHLHDLSERAYAPAEPLLYPHHDQRKLVDKTGSIKVGYGKLFIGQALYTQHVGLIEIDTGVWLVEFAGLQLGLFEVGDTSLSPVERGEVTKRFTV